MAEEELYDIVVNSVFVQFFDTDQADGDRALGACLMDQVPAKGDRIVWGKTPKDDGSETWLGDVKQRIWRIGENGDYQVLIIVQARPYSHDDI